MGGLGSPTVLSLRGRISRDLADAFGRELDFHLHVRAFADDVEDGADAPDFMADFIAFGKGIGNGVFLGQARCDGLGQDGDALFPRDRRRPALGHGALALIFFDEFRRDFPEEAARHVGGNAAVHGACDSVGHVELPFGRVMPT